MLCGTCVMLMFVLYSVSTWLSRRVSSGHGTLSVSRLESPPPLLYPVARTLLLLFNIHVRVHTKHLIFDPLKLKYEKRASSAFEEIVPNSVQLIFNNIYWKVKIFISNFKWLNCQHKLCTVLELIKSKTLIVTLTKYLFSLSSLDI